MKEADIEKDVKENKVKEGMMIKQSRHIKEWRDRWMVLTKTHIYSFSQKGVYKDPTEIIPLANVQTLKSFYKGQYQKPHVFRVQTKDIFLYLSAKSNQDKIAWITAIQKMINRIVSPNQAIDNYAIIRQTLKMVGVMRETTMKNKQPNILNMLKMALNSKIVNIELQPPLKKKEVSNQFWNSEKIKQIQVESKQPQKKQLQIKQKIVQVQKIVYVPQIKQKIVQKVVQKKIYINQNQQNDKQILQNLFQLIIDNQSPHQVALVKFRIQNIWQTLLYMFYHQTYQNIIKLLFNFAQLQKVKDFFLKYFQLC